MGQNKPILEGLYMAPMIVNNAIKTAIYTAYLFEKLGYNVSPKYNEERVDIVENIIFNNEINIILKNLEPDRRVNVIGHVNISKIIVEQLKKGKPFCFIKKEISKRC